MFDTRQHKTVLVRILKEIYGNPVLQTALGFKGGSAAYLFRDLPRLSVDLDFDLLDENKKKEIYDQLKKILLRFGTLPEAIEKRNTIFFLLSYAKGVRKIKVEISKRSTNSKYELKSYLGIPVLVMKKEYMAANKLLALLTRTKFAARDLYDLWFFLKSDWKIDEETIRQRTGLSPTKALRKAIEKIRAINRSALLHGLGELVDKKQKVFIREKLKDELLFNLKLYLEGMKS